MPDHPSYVESTQANTVNQIPVERKKYLVLNHCLTVILDASDVCNTVSFTFGMSSMASREYNIKVTQYECGTNLGGNIIHLFGLLNFEGNMDMHLRDR